MKTFILLPFCFLWLFSCTPKGELTAKDAQELIIDHLEQHPIFEQGKFDTSKQRIDSKKERELLTSLEKLQEEGLIEINNEKTRKKWFTKDSIFVVTTNLTKKALPYVVQQNKNHTLVKTILYKLNESKEVVIEKKSEKNAVCTVFLDKEKTPFYYFGDDSTPKSDFISRKFKLKFSEQEGWKVAK